MGIESKHTDDEKRSCVREYLNGVNKDFLSVKYNISDRTISRWIKDSKIDEVKLNIAKRAKEITVEIQEEIIEVLNTNPIFKGFKISRWNEVMVMRYIKENYKININRRMAKGLIEDSIRVNKKTYEDKVNADIKSLARLGYSIVLLDYIKIGRITSRNVDVLQIRKYKSKRLDVNLVIARAGETMYLDVILSEQNIVSDGRIIIGNSSDKIKEDRRDIIKDKFDILDKVCKEENNDKVIFLTIYDKDIEKLIRKGKNIKFFIIKDDLYSRFIQPRYERANREGIVDYMISEDNKGRLFKGIYDINKDIENKIYNYIHEMECDSDKVKRKIIVRDKIDMKKGENKRKYIKYLNSKYIHNI